MKFLRFSSSILGLCLGLASAQTAPAPLTFDVASVKSAGPLDPRRIMSGEQRVGKKVDKARVEYNSASLGFLIAEAYNVKPYQVTGPDWLDGMSAPRFDIQARLPEGATEAQIPQMLQALLTERFGLKFHKSSKDRNVYDLVIAKTGLKIQPAEAPPATAPEEPQQGIKVSGNMQDGKGVTVRGGPNGGTTKVVPLPDGKGMHIELSLAMDALVQLLTRMVDRPVVDMTELKGSYQVALDLPMAAMMAMAGGMAGGPPGGGDAGKMAEASDPGASIFESVQKMGLALEAHKGPLEFIVIDHLEKTPTEN
jgi:uncharacterized protein (TIGR03435 family)